MKIDFNLKLAIFTKFQHAFEKISGNSSYVIPIENRLNFGIMYFVFFSILIDFQEIGPMFNSGGGARKGGSDSRNRIVEE